MKKLSDKLLFWGELPPETLNGITISSKINLDILESYYEIDYILESNTLHQHDKISTQKIKSFFKSNWLILRKSFQIRYKYFYLVFSVSTAGSIKTLFAIICFKFLNRGKVVLHIHRGDFFSHFLKKKCNTIITKLIFLLTNKIIVLSESQMKEMRFFTNIPCDVLPNTVEIEYKCNQIEKQNINFLFISNYLIDKGILDLLETFKCLCINYPFICLKTYGAFSDNNLKNRILQYSSTNIEINQAICGVEKFKIISNADCLILPSWNEGQPIVLLEAMSVGTPIIASNVGLIPELLDSKYNYLINPKDYISLADALTRFIESKTINKLSKELKERYYNDFSHKKHSEILLQIFK